MPTLAAVSAASVRTYTRQRVSWACMSLMCACSVPCLPWPWTRQKAKRDIYLKGQHMAAFDSTSLAIANSWLDPHLEAYLGYSLFDHVDKAARAYDLSSRCKYHLPTRVRDSLCA